MTDSEVAFYVMIAVGGVVVGCQGLYMVAQGLVTVHAMNHPKESEERKQADETSKLSSSAPNISDIEAARSVNNKLRILGLAEAVVGGLLLFSAAKTAKHVVAGEVLTGSEKVINGVALALGAVKAIRSI
jgi:hypothetical protein